MRLQNNIALGFKLAVEHVNALFCKLARLLYLRGIHTVNQIIVYILRKTYFHTEQHVYAVAFAKLRRLFVLRGIPFAKCLSALILKHIIKEVICQNNRVRTARRIQPHKLRRACLAAPTDLARMGVQLRFVFVFINFISDFRSFFHSFLLLSQTIHFLLLFYTIFIPKSIP